MKAINGFIFFIFFTLNLLIAQETWFWQHPLPQGNDLNDVWVLNQGTIFAVGNQGTLLRSDDGGNNWQVTHRLLGNQEDIVDIEFISDHQGWLLSNREIYDNPGNIIFIQSSIFETIDAGLHWEIIAEFDSIHLNDISFVNQNEGWVTGIRADLDSIVGIVFKTENGGYDWEVLMSEKIDSTWSLENVFSSYFTSIQFLDNDTGWVSGVNQLYKTTDGGLNWQVVCDSMGMSPDLQFLNSTTGWVIYWGQGMGFAGYSIEKTIDGGQSWTTEFYLNWIGYNRPALYFLDENTGWVRENAMIHETTNGGLDWQTDTLESVQAFGAIHLNNSYQGSVVGKYGSIFTKQTQSSLWQQRSLLYMTDNLTEISFLDENIGFAVAYTRWGFDWPSYDTNIFKTTNGGASWEICFEPDPIIRDQFFLTMQIVSDQIIYVGGQGSYKSTNGGIDWQEMTFPPATKVNDLFFLNADTGFVVTGWDHNPGKLSKTINGGSSWQTLLTTTKSIQAICFSDSLNGWAVGWGIPIYKTIDGGNAWFEAAPSEDRLRSVFFNNPDTGWAVGSSGSSEQDIVLKTIDGGYVWEIVYSTDHGYFNSIYFKDTNNGIVIGKSNDYPAKGIIMYTTDGGVTWNEESSIATKGLNNIFFLNEQTGWIVGEEGTVIKTTTGGISSIEETNKHFFSNPENFHLNQNYPNPFNPSTTIEFSIPKTEFVSLKIHNLLGQEVEELVAKRLTPGNYKYNWDASSFASGVYFYKLETSNLVLTKKLILLR